MLDAGWSDYGRETTEQAKTLVTSYFLILKRAMTRDENLTLSWDDIIEATKASLFFDEHPSFLAEINLDLVRVITTQLLL